MPTFVEELILSAPVTTVETTVRVVQTCHGWQAACFVDQHPNLGPYVQAFAALCLVAAGVLNAILPVELKRSRDQRRIKNYIRHLARRTWLASRTPVRALRTVRDGGEFAPFRPTKIEDIIEELKAARKLEVESDIVHYNLRGLELRMRNLLRAYDRLNELLSQRRYDERFAERLLGIRRRALKNYDEISRTTPEGRRELARRKKPKLRAWLDLAFCAGYWLRNRRRPDPYARMKAIRTLLPSRRQTA